MTTGKELSSGLTRGLVTYKLASKFMAEYHEQLGNKVKICNVAAAKAKEAIETAKECSEEVVKVLKTAFQPITLVLRKVPNHSEFSEKSSQPQE